MFDWLFGRKPQKPRWTITLHGSLQHSPQRATAWTVYAGVKTMVRDGTYADDRLETEGMNSPFDEECFGRDALAEFWGVQSAQVRATDPYLRLLARVRDAGLIREYVRRYLREPGWSVPPDADVGRIDTWLAAQGASDHQPVTLGFVVLA